MPRLFLERKRGEMIVPVFVPPSRIDAVDVAGFARSVTEHVARYRCMVIDCSTLVWMATSGMRVLETASHDVQITLVNPCPAVQLMAAAFGGDVQFRYTQAPSPEQPIRGRPLTSVRAGEKDASVFAPQHPREDEHRRDSEQSGDRTSVQPACRVLSDIAGRSARSRDRAASRHVWPV